MAHIALGVILLLGGALALPAHQEPPRPRALPEDDKLLRNHVGEAQEECHSASARDLLEGVPLSGELWVSLLKSIASDSHIGTFRVYESDRWGFSVRYPASWRLRLEQTASGGISVGFWAPQQDSLHAERELLLMNIASAPQSDAIEPAVAPSASIGPSQVLSVLFRWNDKHYGFTDTFSTIVELDAEEIAAVIRSLRFTCP